MSTTNMTVGEMATLALTRCGFGLATLADMDWLCTGPNQGPNAREWLATVLGGYGVTL